MTPKEKARQLPSLPGVYLMKDKHEKIIYIGKAKKLKQRVSSYFQHNQSHSKKILRMVHNIANLEVRIVDTELDALLLECTLIQKYRPLYNRQMNYFKNYNFVDLTDNGFLITDEPSALSFGPFRLYRQLPRILMIISETYQMPWVNNITRLTVSRQLPHLINQPLKVKELEIKQLLLGNNALILSYLKIRQAHVIQQLNFEKAAKLEEDYQLVQRFIQKIQHQNKFINTPSMILTDTIAANEKLLKFYHIQFGKITDTKIMPVNALPTFTLQNKIPPWSSHKNHLPKEAIDPLQILISHQNKNKTNKKALH